MKKREQVIFWACTGICVSALANADTFTAYTPMYPVAPLVCAVDPSTGTAANTAGSFAAASEMGAEGFIQNYVVPNGWQNTILTSCAARTLEVRVPDPGNCTAGPNHTTYWPSNCNPCGMARALHDLNNDTWVTATWPSTALSSALSVIVGALQVHRSVAVVPMYGQADHWVALTKIQFDVTTNKLYNVTELDGGPPGDSDSSGGGYISTTWSWTTFAGTPTNPGGAYYKVLTAINSACDSVQPNGCGTPPYSDPYYGQYLLTYEPRTNPPLPGVDGAVFHGVAPHGMTAALARILVWRALFLASITEDPDVWNPIRGTVAGPASLVNGVFPSGEPWDYYLVPMLSSQDPSTVVAFVQLSADNGTFQAIHTLSTPMPFAPVELAKAEQTARGALAGGESLVTGTLTWDPRNSDSRIARSPIHPYYEFGVVNTASKTARRLRVRFHDGAVVGTP